jgi:heptose I phosphotransferase
MTVIAAGAEGETRRRRSFFLSDAVAGVPADEYWKAHPDPAVRGRVIEALANTARRFHEAGLFHLDFYWCHFFIGDDGTSLTARLIDLQRVLRRPRLPWRWRVKDLGQFWFSAPEGVTADERRIWFDRYAGGESHRAMEWAARVRAQFYQFKDGRAA